MKAANDHSALLRIYLWGEASSTMLNLAKTAACLGIRSELVNLALRTSPADDLRSSALAGASVWDIESLSSFIDAEAWTSLAELLPGGNASVLIITRGCSVWKDEILRILTKGRVIGARSAGRPEVARFPANGGGWSAQLSGFEYRRSGTEALALEAEKDSGIETIMDYGDGLPAMVVFPAGRSQLFVWSAVSVFDMDQPLGRELEFEEATDEYIPAIIFLRAGFGERCWHNPRQDADIVIDDPLLEKRYGQIDFPELLGLARELDLHVTVAFIPWNHWRTRELPLRVFLDHSGSFGICAHGCDHISREFRTSDYGDLLGRSRLAAERMDRHRERTGMDWDRLMVCPREEYTLDAVRALADSGRFLGMVNTGCIPRDLETRHVRGSDLLWPAHDSFFGFPLFKRHYWSDISVFAMGAFLGKPAILVEHHDFFQNHCRSVKEFATKLRGISPSVRWMNLTSIASQTHSRKLGADGGWDIRFFADEFTIRNPDTKPQTLRFQRRMPADIGLESVTLNGARVPSVRDGDILRFETELQPGGVAFVQVRRCAVPADGAVPGGLIYEARVALRRALSEFRDNSRPPARQAAGLEA
jgi:hypothetical protein